MIVTLGIIAMVPVLFAIRMAINEAFWHARHVSRQRRLYRRNQAWADIQRRHKR